MSLSDVVTVTVVVQNPGVTQAGFGVPLLLSHSATWVERTRTYSSALGLAADFPVNSPEYLSGSTMFSQAPAVPLIMVGRSTVKPTQTFSLGCVTPLTGTTYSVRVAAKSGSAWVSQIASFTAVTSLNDDIMTGLKGAIDVLAAPVVSGIGSTQFTTALAGSSGSRTITITSNTAGTFFGIQVLNLLQLSQQQTQGDPGIVADLTAIAQESTAWYGLQTLFNSPAIILAAAGFAESNTKLYIAATQDSLVATQANGVGTDIAQSLAAADRARTGPCFHPANDEFLDAGELGRWLSIAPGSDNWRLKQLSGPSAQVYTQTQITNLNAKFCNYYYVLGGANVVGGNGKVSANEYIDVVRGIDWWTAGVSEKIANALIQNEKIPYTDAGVLIIENQVRAQNAAGVAAGLIASSPAPVVTVPKVADVPNADKQSRTLNNVNTNWTLAGAINKINVNVQVSA